jgi:ATP-dependent Clp protease ATP-binding subunit ClpA
MLEQFTENAKKAVFFAQEEAGALGENEVSTEHLLLAILREPNNTADHLLQAMGVDPDALDNTLRGMVKPKRNTPTEMTLSPQGKRVIDLALEEAKRLGADHIGTEHLLLGLIDEGEGLASKVLLAAGATLESAREAIASVKGASVWPPPIASHTSASPGVVPRSVTQMTREALRTARIALAIAAGFFVITIALTADQIISQQKPYFGAMWLLIRRPVGNRRFSVRPHCPTRSRSID